MTLIADAPASAPEAQPQAARFRLRDARVPPAHELMAALWGDVVLQGQIVGRSRAAGDETCVVVRIAGLDQMVVVSEGNLLADG